MYSHLFSQDATFRSVKAFLGDMIQYASIGNLIITSLERFIALRHPLLHLRSVTRDKVICATLVLLLVSTIPVSVYVVLNPNPSQREQINNALIGFYIFDNSLIIVGILTVQTLLFLTYLTIRKSVQKKLQEVKTLTHKQNSRYLSSTIVQEGKNRESFISL